MSNNPLQKFPALILLSFLMLQIVIGDQLRARQPDEYGFDILSFQKAHVVEVFAKTSKSILIDRQELSKYIRSQNEVRVMGKFLLQCKNIVRSAEISVSIYTKGQNQGKIKQRRFSVNNAEQDQESAVFKLSFFSQFNFSEVHRIIINIKAAEFSVLSLALLNNQLSHEIDLTRLSPDGTDPVGTVPIWLPFSYDHKQDKFEQMVKYIYFKGGQIPTKLRLNRIKGHPKIFLYNCQLDKFEFCRLQIEKQHVQGTLILQKQIEVSVKQEPNCQNCWVIFAFKNMGAQINLEITHHSSHQNLLISKDLPIYYHLKKNSTLNIVSYYILQTPQNKTSPFLDFSFVQGNSNSISLEAISIDLLSQQTKLEPLTPTDFLFQNRTNAIRIKLSSTFKAGSQTVQNLKEHEIWYRIRVKIVSKANCYFSVVDRNVPLNEDNFITLKDGEIFHSYSFDDYQDRELNSEKNIQAFPTYNFKIKVPLISTLSISTSCTEFNQLHIQFYTDPSKITRVNPKAYLENITQYNQKCSQLIHFNPTQLFGQITNQENLQNSQIDLKLHNSKGGWIYFKLSGIRNQVNLLYSSSDIIQLQKSFSYHSQLIYKQALYLYVPNVKDKAIIKIRKCTDCHISLSYSQGQLADLKVKRSEQITTKQLLSINNAYLYQKQGNHGLYIKVTTNNFAYFVITVQEISEQFNDYNFPSQTNQGITYSLTDDNQLVLQFSPPQFIQGNNLNSPIHFSLIEGSASFQVSRELYCPEFIFNQKQKTRDVSITQITPQLTHDLQGHEIMKFNMELKHHDFFGIRAQKGSQIFSYQVVNIQSMKEYAQYRWSIFNVLLFLTFAIFMSFVCFMGLKSKRVKKIGGEVVLESEDGQQTSMIRLN